MEYACKQCIACWFEIKQYEIQAREIWELSFVAYAKCAIKLSSVKSDSTERKLNENDKSI